MKRLLPVKAVLAVAGAIALSFTAVPAYAAVEPFPETAYFLPCGSGNQLFSYVAGDASGQLNPSPVVSDAFSDFSQVCYQQPAVDPTTGILHVLVQTDAGAYLATVDETSGAVTAGPKLDFDNPDTYPEAIAIGLDGTAFAMAYTDVDDQESAGNLYRIDLSTGSATFIADTHLLEVTGMAVQPSSGTLFAATGYGTIFSIDATTGTASSFVDLDSLYHQTYGLASLQFDDDGNWFVLNRIDEGPLQFEVLWFDPYVSGLLATTGPLLVGAESLITASFFFSHAAVGEEEEDTPGDVGTAPVGTPAVAESGRPELAETGIPGSSGALAIGALGIIAIGSLLLAAKRTRRRTG